MLNYPSLNLKTKIENRKPILSNYNQEIIWNQKCGQFNLVDLEKPQLNSKLTTNSNLKWNVQASNWSVAKQIPNLEFELRINIQNVYYYIPQKISEWFMKSEM